MAVAVLLLIVESRMTSGPPEVPPLRQSVLSCTRQPIRVSGPDEAMPPPSRSAARFSRTSTSTSGSGDDRQLVPEAPDLVFLKVAARNLPECLGP